MPRSLSNDHVTTSWCRLLAQRAGMRLCQLCSEHVDLGLIALCAVGKGPLPCISVQYKIIRSFDKWHALILTTSL